MKDDAARRWTAICERIQVLRESSYGDLAKLPASDSVEVSDHARKFALTTWVDRIDDHLRVVVQAYTLGSSPMQYVQADGFRMDSHGKILPLADGEIYEFL